MRTRTCGMTPTRTCGMTDQDMRDGDRPGHAGTVPTRTCGTVPTRTCGTVPTRTCGSIPTRASLLPYTSRASLLPYTSRVHHVLEHAALSTMSWCTWPRCPRTGPWALTSRISLGEVSFDTQDPLSQLQFVRSDRPSFPDRNGQLIKRSDVTGATPTLAA